MFIEVVKSKIHRVKITQAELHYVGSITIDEDLMDAGVIDPTKVVRSALQNAASVAGLLITTEAMVAELPKKDEPAMPPGGGMGDMGGMM